MTSGIVWSEIKLLTREPLTLLMSLLFPIVLMVLLVMSFGNEPDPTMGGIGGSDFYVPIYASATVAVMGLLGIPTHLAGYRNSGVLRRFRASGVPGWTMIPAQTTVMTTLVVFGVAVMVAIGFAFYDLSEPESISGVVVGFALGTLAFAGIGSVLGANLPTSRAAQGLGLLLFFGLFFIAGGGPPPAILPDSINTFVSFTPMGPLVDAVS
ncbi:MAG: hypothetical protein GEU79_16630, partial [Acidimicrobiia bacterium]|nr:hypothetical protein [Acidimicrobiia bacterium]